MANAESDPNDELLIPETPGEEMLASQVKSILLRARSRKLRGAKQEAEQEESQIQDKKKSR